MMRGITNQQAAAPGFVRSTLLVAGCILVVGLLLAPFAARQTEMNGIFGLAAAGAICLVAAALAEGVGGLLARNGAHLAAMLFSMAMRFIPPLAVCFVLAASGAGGRQYLAFISYLLAFYFATLGVETWLAVKRVHGTPTK
jgi:hypothetical protein